MKDFIINKKEYKETEIVSLTREKFCLRYIQEEKPIKLFKYFPNTISEKDNINHSIEALQNNTVYLQNPVEFDDPYDCTLLVELDVFAKQRAIYYAKLFGIEINLKWDYLKILNELSMYLYNYISNGKQLVDIFSYELDESNHVYLRHKKFMLTIQNKLIEYSSYEDVWQRAIDNAIYSEYIEAKEFVHCFRVSCFTTSPYSMLMWSHYANNHKGFCIEYEIPNYSKENLHLFHNLFPVIYSEQRTSVLPYCMNALNKEITDDILWAMYKYGLLTKSMDWNYQDEWRLVSYDNKLSEKLDYKCKFFKITKVYLGAKMEKAERLKIIDICKDKIPYVGVIANPNKFQMTDCQGKCEKCNKVID